MKLLYMDCETTGVDRIRSAIIQLGMIVEIDGEVVDEKDILIRPFKGAHLSDEAFKSNRHEPSKIIADPYLEPAVAKRSIIKFWDKYVAKFDKNDKFIPVAYNGGFDIDFISEWWNRVEDKFLGSYINRSRMIDPLNRIRWALFAKESWVPNLNKLDLSSVCESFGVELKNAHDALADCRALRELTRRLVELQFPLIEVSGKVPMNINFERRPNGKSE